MITRYLTIKYVKPIPVKLKEDFNLFNLVSDYIDAYGDCFIGLFDDYDDAIINQQLWYEMYGDIDLCKDLNTIEHLDKCYQLEYKE